MDPESRPNPIVPDSHARAPIALDCRGGRGKPDPARDQTSPEVYSLVHASQHEDARTSTVEGGGTHVEEMQGGGAEKRGH